MTAMIDVIAYGLGPIGARIAQRVLLRGDLRLAGAVDIDPAKAGRDLGDVIGAGSTGLPIVNDIALLGVRERGAVAVHATASSLAAAAPQIVGLCERGFNIVSTCEQLAWPHDQPELAKRIDAAARTAGVSVIGSGINPGFLMDTLPLVLTAACVRVDHVTVRRVVDTNLRRLPLQQKTGVGLSVEEFRARADAGSLGHVGLRQSASMLAHGMGWTIESYSETLEPVVATGAIETGLGTVSVGACIGQRQLAIATSGGRNAIRYELEMSAGAAPFDEIEIDGEPPIRQRIEGGVNGDIGTEAVIVNLIPVISAASPGLLTMRDLYPLTARGG
jgi:4-hydroxy-tetrahydrodipicolinate reductase